MTDSKGYYALLGVSEKAGYQQIKHAYRGLARKYHPDRNSSAFAEDMIKKINAAFEVLSDETKRRQYDRMNFDSLAESAPEPHYTAAEDKERPAATNESYETTTTTFADFFNNNNSGQQQYYLDMPKGRFHVIVEPTLCMAFGSCETLAPKVFVVEKNKRMNPKARVECETCAEYEKIHAAASTCPTKAIKIVDRYTGEQLYP